jgi:hypothetical protein
VLGDPTHLGVSTTVELNTKEGATFIERLDSTIYSLSTLDEIEQKFMNLSMTAVSESRAKEIMKLVYELDDIKDIRVLGDILRIQ